MNTPENPSAFPNTPTDLSGQIAPHECGMTLRDYFAAKTISCFLVTPDDMTHMLDGGGMNHDVVAKFCYELADAMLAARQHKEGK